MVSAPQGYQKQTSEGVGELSHFSGSKRNARGSREQQGQQGTAGSLRSHEVMSSAPRRPEAGALQGLAEPGVLEEPQRARVAVIG